MSEVRELMATSEPEGGLSEGVWSELLAWCGCGLVLDGGSARVVVVVLAVVVVGVSTWSDTVYWSLLEICIGRVRKLKWIS